MQIYADLKKDLVNMNIYMSYNLHVVQTDEKGVLSFRIGLTTNFLLTKTFKQRIFALYKLAKKIYFFFGHRLYKDVIVLHYIFFLILCQ